MEQETITPIAAAPAPASAPLETPRRSSFWGRLLARVRDNRWALPPILALIVARALLIHPDVTDFPMDRNIGAAFQIKRVMNATAWDQLDLSWERYASIFKTPEIPEFPFLPLLARVITEFGLDPLAAGRAVSLLAALLTGIGVYILARRVHSRPAGLAALWLYALLPFSIFMGRTLLPDPLMAAAVVWSLVAASAPSRASEWRRVRRVAFWLIVAALAKLPALVFSPVAAFWMMQRMGWSRKDAWLKLAVTALVTWLAVCAWYDLWNPLAGLQRISANTNHMTDALGDLGGSRVEWVVMMRIVLALSLPGAFLAILGLAYAQRRPQRLPMNLWFAASLGFVPLTLGANTYWVCAILPAAAVLGGLALVELGRSLRGARAALGLILLGLLGVCPSLNSISTYLGLHPEYRDVRAVADKVLTRRGDVYYMGRLPSDLMWFIQRAGDGIGFSAGSPEPILKRLKDDNFDYLVTSQMHGCPPAEALFPVKPVLAMNPGQYAMIDVRTTTTLGEVAPPAPTQNLLLPLNLADRLKVIDIVTSPSAPLAPGGALEVAITWERGPAWQGAPNVALEFVHAPSGVAFPTAPSNHALEMNNWFLPLLQTPDFSDAPRKTMRYSYALSPHLPAGSYSLRFLALADRVRPVLLAPALAAPRPTLEVAPPAQPASLPLSVNLAEGWWRNPIFTTSVSWLGARRDVARLTTGGQLRLRPALPPGRYTLSITAAARPAGANPKEMWPILAIRKPGEQVGGLKMYFKSESMRTRTVTFDWAGPQDFLTLSIPNPLTDNSTGDPFSLYLDACAKGTRAIVLEKIVIDREGGAAQ